MYIIQTYIFMCLVSLDCLHNDNVSVFHAYSILGGSGHWEITPSMAWLRGKVLVKVKMFVFLLSIIILCFITHYMLDSLNNVICLIAAYIVYSGKLMGG